MATLRGHAPGLGNAGGDQRLVATEVITDEGAAPNAEELPRMLAGAARGEVVDHTLDRLEGAGAIGPQVGAMGLAGTGTEHSHRCLVGVQDLAGQQLGLQGIDHRLQGNAAIGPAMRVRL